MSKIREKLKLLFPIQSRFGRRFLFFMVLVSTVPIVLMGFLALMLINDSHRHNVSRLERQVLSHKEEEIQNFVGEIVSIFQIHFNLPVEQLFIKEGEARRYLINRQDLDSIARDIISENKWVQGVYFVDRSGEIASSVTRYSESDILEGGIVLSDISQTPCWDEVLAGHDHLGLVNHTPSGPIMLIASPVKNVNGRIVGGVIGEVSLERVEQIIDRTILGASGYSLLTDSEGILVAHSDNIGISAELADLSSLSRVQKVLAGGEQTGLEESDRFTSIFGEEVIAAGKRVPELNWGLFVEWPVDDAEAVLQMIRQQVITFSLLSLLIVLLVVFLIASRLVRPIRHLQKGVKEVSGGNFEYKVDIKTNDELEDLGKAFNLMGRALKQLQDLKNEFVFIAAHELRAPVTVINFSLLMIFEDYSNKLSPQIKELLEPIKKAGDNLNKLVEDLLQVARSDSGKIEVSVNPVDIVKETREIVDQLGVVAKNKSIKIAYDPPSGLPKVLADADKLKEVLKNLIDNAVKYTIGSGTVAVSHEIKDNMIITRVKDMGIGISEEEQKKLFEKFYRVKTKEAKDIPGTGLGLWIIRQLVEKMNGKIWVKSQKGKGSTFSFSLPIAHNKP